MLNRIADLITSMTSNPDRAASYEFKDTAVAAAVLMIEAARQDGDPHPNEFRAMAERLTQRYNLTPDERESLIALAVEKNENLTHLFQLTGLLKDQKTRDERKALMEDLWAVAYADGELHKYEADIIERIGKMLGMTGMDIQGAKQRAAG
ncbi:MAG: TerB family tellurite resistance protein [Alphaproteobacteria bacterium]